MRRGAACALAICCAMAQAGAGEPQPVDLELVLAVDNSLSVNRREFDLQVTGIADAFRDPGVVDAILSHRGVAVAVVLWSNHLQQETGVDWSLLREAEAISKFADAVAGMSRIAVSGGTGLGAALAFAIRAIDANDFAGDRRVVDVSGDGRNNMGEAPNVIRDLAVARGMTINGLAILDEEPRLDRYYAANVVGGPGAFLEIAADFDSFAAAMRRKLLREFGGKSLALRDAPARVSSGN